MSFLNYKKIEDSSPISKKLEIIFVIVLALRITSYFTLNPNSLAVTQVLKIGIRIMVTYFSVNLYFKMKNRDAYQGYEYDYQNFGALFFYILYLILGLVSVFWSSKFSYSLLQLFMIIEGLVFVYYFYHVFVLYNKATGDRIPWTMLLSRSVFIISAIFLIGLWIDPDTFYRLTHGGEVARLGGFIINPNELGMLAVLGATMVDLEFVKKRNIAFNILNLIACIAILLLTQSRSSLGSFLMISGFIVLIYGGPQVKIGSLILAVLVMPVIVNTIIVKQGDLEEVMSMTGRLPFWQDLINDGFVVEPIKGFGFMRIAYTDYFYSVHSYAAKMTHNTFVQVLLNLGLLGVYICSLQMIFTFYSIFTWPDKFMKLVGALSLIPLIINSITEFGIFGENNYGILFYQFVFMFYIVTVIEVPKKVSLETSIKNYDTCRNL